MLVGQLFIKIISRLAGGKGYLADLSRNLRDKNSVTTGVRLFRVVARACMECLQG